MRYIYILIFHILKNISWFYRKLQQKTEEETQNSTEVRLHKLTDAIEIIKKDLVIIKELLASNNSCSDKAY